MDAAPHPDFLPPADGSDRRAWLRLCELGRTWHVPAGHGVVQPGRVPAFVHVVVSGLLIAEVVAPAGHDIGLALLQRGDLFGEAALTAMRPPVRGIESDREIPIVRALMPSRVLSIGAGELHDALRGDERLRLWVHARLVERIRRSEAMLLRALCLSVQDRLEKLLWELAGSFESRDEAEAGLPFTQEILARLVGATRESVNRAVGSLVREGRLVRKGRSYSVPGRRGGA